MNTRLYISYIYLINGKRVKFQRHISIAQLNNGIYLHCIIMAEISHLGRLIYNFSTSDLFPLDLSINWMWPYVRPINTLPPPKKKKKYIYICTCYLWTTGQDHQRVAYLCCWVTPQLPSLHLGLWPLESGTSEIVQKKGDVGHFLKWESSKQGCQTSLCV